MGTFLVVAVENKWAEYENKDFLDFHESSYL